MTLFNKCTAWSHLPIDNDVAHSIAAERRQAIAMKFTKSLKSKMKGVFLGIAKTNNVLGVWTQTNSSNPFPELETLPMGKFGFGHVGLEITGDSMVHNIRPIKVIYSLSFYFKSCLFPVFYAER